MKRFWRWLAAALLIGALVFALPTWWMRIWLPYQGSLPTPTAASTASTLEAEYRQAVELAAADPLAALPLLSEIAFSESPHAGDALALRQGIQAGRQAGDEAYLLTATGQALAAVGEWQAARQALLGAVDLNPEYAEAWAYLGEALQQTGQDGLPALERAQELDPNSLSVRLFLALYWQRQGEYQRAENNLRVAALHHPDNALIQIQLGENAVMMDDAPGALPYFQRALELAPRTPAILRALAAYSVESALYLEEIGLPATDRLLAQGGQQAETLLLRARALALLRRDDEAETYFNRALEADPRFTAAHLYYGIFLLAGQHTQQARQHFNEVLALTPVGAHADLAAYWLEQISQ